MNCLRVYLALANALRVGFGGQDASGLRGKAIDARGLSHAERMRIDASVRDATFFSAKVSDAALLEKMRGYIAGAAEGRPGMHRAAFIDKMREAMGMPKGERPESDLLTDVRSSRRLGLIYDFQRERLDAERFLAQGNDPDHAWAFPALELVRTQARRMPRDWKSRWVEAGGKLVEGERMVALRGDPIWTAISRFGSPTPPFDFNSGMGLREIDVDEAEALGLVRGEGDEEGARSSEPFSFPGAERIDEPKFPPEAEDRSVVMPPRPEKMDAVGEIERYADALLNGEDKRRCDFSAGAPEHARAVVEALEKAKRSGLLDAAGVSRVTIVDELKDPRGVYFGDVEFKTGVMRLSKASFGKNGGSTTPIHEVVHMFNLKLESTPKLFEEIQKMHKGYKRKAAGVRGGLPPFSSDAGRRWEEFLSEAVAYYLNGRDVYGYGKRCFDLLKKLVKIWS